MIWMWVTTRQSLDFVFFWNERPFTTNFAVKAPWWLFACLWIHFWLAKCYHRKVCVENVSVMTSLHDFRVNHQSFGILHPKPLVPKPLVNHRLINLLMFLSCFLCLFAMTITSQIQIPLEHTYLVVWRCEPQFWCMYTCPIHISGFK